MRGPARATNVALNRGGGLFGAVQAHRAVDLAAGVEQGDLLDTCGQQLTPVLPEPGLGVTLGREGLATRSLARDLVAVGTFVPPCPRHVRNVSGVPIDAGGAVVVLSLRNRRVWGKPVQVRR